MKKLPFFENMGNDDLSSIRSSLRESLLVADITSTIQNSINLSASYIFNYEDASSLSHELANSIIKSLKVDDFVYESVSIAQSGFEIHVHAVLGQFGRTITHGAHDFTISRDGVLFSTKIKADDQYAVLEYSFEFLRY